MESSNEGDSPRARSPSTSFTISLAIGLAGCSNTGVASPSDVKNTTGGSAAWAAPKDKIGTRSNPEPAVTAIAIAVKDVSGSPQYTVTVGAVTMEGGAAVTEENKFNELAKPGFHYMLIPVT